MIEEKNKMEVLNNDIIFKNIFNVKETIKRLLEETLELKVKEVYLANTEMPVEKIKERRKILDLVVYTEKEVINVEVNNAYKKDLYIRNFLYFCKLISSNLEKSKDYTKLGKHIQLNLTWNMQKYIPFDIREKKKLEFYVKDEETGLKVFEDKFKIVNINMDYYVELWYSKKVEKESPFLLLLAAPTIEEMDEIARGDRLMEKIAKEVKKLNFDPKITEEIAFENEHEIWANTMHSRGVEQGIEKGIEKGIEQGSKQEKIGIARNMLKDNMPIDTIIKYTGLKKEEIESLQ